MKLYEIPKESKIRLPIGDGAVENAEYKLLVCDFHHIDGMYSYITTPNGGAVHLGASSEVKLGDDGIYELV